MKSRKVYGTEIILYVVYSVLAVAGLTLIVLGIIGDLITLSTNPLAVADGKFAAKMKMSFTVFGTLVVVLNALFAAITLAAYGQKAELEADKKARRLQRLQFEEEIKENVVETTLD